MDVLQAVTKDLAHFVFIEYFGFKEPHTPALDFTTPRELPPATRPKAAVVPRSRAATTVAGTGQTLYVHTDDAHLFASPVATFDGAISRLPYGVVLQHITTQNRWYEVVHGDMQGWVLRENVSESAINPQFISGETYAADSKETKELRAFIADNFFGGQLHSPLQDVEYIAYRLLRKGIVVPWGNERPRIAGTWQRLLRGKPGVHIGINPKVDAVMELIDEDVGRLLYVDAVFPDQSLLVSEVGHPQIGQFNAQTLSKEAWVELKPIFIEVS